VTQEADPGAPTSTTEAEVDDPNAVDAEPTKDFFVSMLTRDIDLKDAIVDLVDNSIDGARRMRSDQDFDGLWVRLSFDLDPPVAGGPETDTTEHAASFVIEDNCGGMSVEVARKYAFRFGRDTRVTRATGRSIGQFGVGMKRTLFKMGAGFSIESKTTTERFVLDVVVDDWRRSRGWDFHFTELDTETTRSEDETGTRIEVRPLFPDVAAQVGDTEWLAGLEEDVQFKHGQSIRNGATIEIGGEPVNVEPLELLVGEGLRPAVRHEAYAAEPGDGTEPAEVADQPDVDRTVEVKLVAGVSTASPRFAGWYVYCNGRLVLGPDRTRATVWGVSGAAKNPIYHDQFARFRGYAFFESDDPSRLPWTTTKTGVDVDNAIWKDSRGEMMLMTRPVIDFLNLLDKQNTAAGGAAVAAAEPTPPPEGPQPSEKQMEYAERTLANATRADVLTLTGAESDFEVPEIDQSGFVDPKVRVSFARDSSEVELVRNFIGPDEQGKRRKNGDLGEEAWEYYLVNEIRR
jgi:hypothetical protein